MSSGFKASYVIIKDYKSLIKLVKVLIDGFLGVIKCAKERLTNIVVILKA